MISLSGALISSSAESYPRSVDRGVVGEQQVAVRGLRGDRIGDAAQDRLHLRASLLALPLVAAAPR